MVSIADIAEEEAKKLGLEFGLEFGKPEITRMMFASRFERFVVEKIAEKNGYKLKIIRKFWLPTLKKDIFILRNSTGDYLTIPVHKEIVEITKDGMFGNFFTLEKYPHENFARRFYAPNPFYTPNPKRVNPGRSVRGAIRHHFGNGQQSE